MKQQLPFLFLFITFLGISPSVCAQNITLELNPNLKNQMNITEGPLGTYDIKTLGGDPWILTYPVEQTYDPEKVYVISFDYIAPEGLDNLQAFYGTPLDGRNRRKDFGSLAASTDYTSFKVLMKYEVDNWNTAYDGFRFDFGKASGQNIIIKNLQLRAATVDEVLPIDLDLTRRNQMDIVEDPEDFYSITTLEGGDPFIFSEILSTVYNPEEIYVLSFDYTAPQGLDDLRIFYGQPISGTRRADLGALDATVDSRNFSAIMPVDAPVWNDFYDLFRFDFGKAAGQELTVTNLVLRQPTNAEKKLLEVKETVDLELNVNATSPDLTATETAPGSYILNTSENDPWIRTKPIDVVYDIEETYIISFEYRAEKPYNEMEILYGPPINGAQKFTAGSLPATDGWESFVINPKLLLDGFQESAWSVFRFDFGRNEFEDKTIEIRNLQLRKPTAQEFEEEQNSDKFTSLADNQELLSYLNTTFQDSVSVVKIEIDSLEIGGEVENSSEELFLAEIEPHRYGFDQTEFDFVVPLTFEENKFAVKLSRFKNKEDHDYDRLYSRWAVVRKTGESSYELTSAARWATDISQIAENNLEEEKSATIKGLDGLTPNNVSYFEDLVDLDIKNMKINLILPSVFSLNPSPLSHDFNGKSYFINQNFVQGFDELIKRTTEAGIKASVVLLIPYRQNERLADIFNHPDAFLGNYSMANVATAEGVEYYTAMIDFLAKRYSRPDKQYGRLDQWIIHNEVDAHTVWTHAGVKPIELYTQIYDRSMRMVHYTIRKYNPTAKVFASFTKHWNSKPVSDVNFKSKDILETQVRLSQKEGDYEWNIGWHSYPTNLFDPAVWDDPPSETQFNFDTPQITPRNLEMIDAFVRQQKVLYNGKKVRTILLSENGFNSKTETFEKANETVQSAAIAYFWKKVHNRLPSIESIQYHRWVDNRNLNFSFGLWTRLEGTVDDLDRKKEAWHVWEAAGTSRENVVFDPYKSIIGIDSWNEIYQDVSTEVDPHTIFMNIEKCNSNLDDLLVSFNGELKIPQEDGTLVFYNVASNVSQPYEVRKGDVLLASDVLNVNEDMEITIDIEAIGNVIAKGISPSEIEINWESSVENFEGFVIEVKKEGESFEELDRISQGEFNYIHEGVAPGEQYTYRIAGLYDENTFSCYSEEVEVIAPFLIVDYKDGDKDKPESNKIRPHLLLQNESENIIDLSRATVRYWFTAEDYSSMIFKAEQTGTIDKKKLFGDFVALEPTLEGADYYLELSFSEGAEISALESSGEIRMKIEKSNPSAFNELDDYSYAPLSTYQQTDEITVYWDGELIWGEEPGEATTSEEKTASNNSSSLLAVYPNPAHRSTNIKWDGKIRQAGNFRLIDYNGISHAVSLGEKYVDELTLNFSKLKPGIYILKGSINGEDITHRLLVQ